MPIDMTVNIQGGEALAAKLARGETIDSILKPAMLQSVLYVQSQIPPYPPAIPESTYTRTNTLGRTLRSLQGGPEPDALSRVESLGAHTIGYVGTKLTYAPDVIDEENQARLFRERDWFTLQSVVRGAIDEVIKILRAAIMNHIEG